MRALSTLLAALALALAAGCGDDEPDPTPPAVDGAPDALAIGMRDLKFDPAEATAKVGQLVTWTNLEAVPHNVVADKGADFESDVVGENGSYQYTPQEAGTISYVCTIHPGMEGTLTVEE